MRRNSRAAAALLALAAFRFPLRAQEKAPEKKEGALAPPDPAVVAKIEKSGGSVRKIAQNDEHLEVDFHLQGASVKDADVAPIAQLKNVVRLHLGKTGITDAGLAAVKGLTGLQELHLEQTAITDKGLANLKGLTELNYLNLYGTGVTDAGLAQLAGLKNLKHLYVWQTKVTEPGVEKLKKGLPELSVSVGWDKEVKTVQAANAEKPAEKAEAKPAKKPDEKK